VQKRAGRPIASALAATLEHLQSNPDITAAELAELLRVTQSYARTLLRRARERCAPAVTDRLASIATPALAPTPVARTPVASRRTAALKLAGAGHSTEHIAEKLQTTAGEVEFILKVQRLICA
jgi:DNA-binding NarL/FixJ family response regulator